MALVAGTGASRNHGSGPSMLKWLLVSVVLILFAWAVWALVIAPELRSHVDPPVPANPHGTPRELAAGRHLTVWWDEIGAVARNSGCGHHRRYRGRSGGRREKLSPRKPEPQAAE